MIDRGMLYTYLSNYHTPDRMVLAGVGIDHDSFVELAREYFVKKTPIWTEHSDIIDPRRGRDESIAQYTGSAVCVSLRFRVNHVVVSHHQCSDT